MWRFCKNEALKRKSCLKRPVRINDINKQQWSEMVINMLNENDSKCEQYMNFIDGLYIMSLNKMGGISCDNQLTPSSQLKQIFTPIIKYQTIEAMINLVHFEKFTDDTDGFTFSRNCKKEEYNDTPTGMTCIAVNSDLIDSGSLNFLLENLSCFNCKSNKHYSEMKRCGRCYNACYCSKQCQQEDWSVHKKNVLNLQSNRQI